MSIYKLFVLPTDQTRHTLESMFQAGPFSVDWDHLGVLLGTSREPISTLPDSVTYQAKPGSMNVWYDTATAISHLLLPLIPERKMAERHAEVGDVFSEHFIPVMSFGAAPGLTRRVRAWMNSIATGLVDREPILEFHAELVVQDDNVVEEFADFRYDYRARGMMSNQYFIALDNGVD